MEKGSNRMLAYRLAVSIYYINYKVLEKTIKSPYIKSNMQNLSNLQTVDLLYDANINF